MHYPVKIFIFFVCCEHHSVVVYWNVSNNVPGETRLALFLLSKLLAGDTIINKLRNEPAFWEGTLFEAAVGTLPMIDSLDSKLGYPYAHLYSCIIVYSAWNDLLYFSELANISLTISFWYKLTKMVM